MNLKWAVSTTMAASVASNPLPRVLQPRGFVFNGVVRSCFYAATHHHFWANSTPAAASITAASKKSISGGLSFSAKSARVRGNAGGQRYRPLSISCSSAASAEIAMHTLPDGKRLEVVSMKATPGAGKPPLLFIHGSYHAAWCWEENFLPYFSELGHDCYALSLRAQGGSDPIEQPVAGTVAAHAADIASFVATLPVPPIVVAHSFGGLPLQWYVGKMSMQFPPLAGTVFMASVPQNGNKDLVRRYFAKDFFLALKITWWFIRKSFGESDEACRRSFFSEDLPQDDLLRYMDRFKNSSPTRLIDLKNVNEIIPLPQPPMDAPPVLVMGGSTDAIVDDLAVSELAQHWRTKAVMVDDVAHDMMLDTRWRAAASTLAAWLEAECQK